MAEATPNDAPPPTPPEEEAAQARIQKLRAIKGVTKSGKKARANMTKAEKKEQNKQKNL